MTIQMTTEPVGSLMMWRSVSIGIGGIVLLAWAVLCGDVRAQRNVPAAARSVLEEREKLNATVWHPEQLAQQRETSITWLWDQLRLIEKPSQVAQEIVCEEWILPTHANHEVLGLGITRQRFSPPEEGKQSTLSKAGLLEWLAGLEAAGWRLRESELHHTGFSPATDGEAAVSVVGFLFHMERAGVRSALQGKAEIVWKGAPVRKVRAQSIRVKTCRVIRGGAQPAFVRAGTFSRREKEFQSAHPVLLHDLDRDGDVEIVLPRWNRCYDNDLAGNTPQLRDRAFLQHWQPQEECGLLADVNADGYVDYLTVVKAQGLTVYHGDAIGSFPHPGRVLFQSNQIQAPLAMTAGDIDQDGDLDLWLTQYKPSYVGGQMPTPFYDANDGLPSFLLVQDDGRFHDATEAHGLGQKRWRRTYSTSFIDLNDDHHLDLVVVSDYAGVDVYRNDGRGHFQDISSSFQPNRLFGMSHCLADFNQDTRLDLLTIGMSSSTARRLDSLGLGKADRKDYQTHRAAMGYGNRLFLATESGFVQSPHNDQIARTGWSWGTTALDVDNDGDRDIYVANGFRSGKSSKDYCSQYWCHDLYTGNSKENQNLVPVFAESMLALNQGLMSWNGYEHNHLKMNVGEGQFENVAYPMGVSFEYDARVALAEDIDGDGREDLLVSDYQFLGKGFQSTFHLYLNRLPLENDWIAFTLTPSPKHQVLGARVLIDTNHGRQVHPIVSGDGFLSQDAYSAHFGLGRNGEVTAATILWPNGETTELTQRAINQRHHIVLD